MKPCVFKDRKNANNSVSNEADSLIPWEGLRNLRDGVSLEKLEDPLGERQLGVLNWKLGNLVSGPKLPAVCSSTLCRVTVALRISIPVFIR